MLERKINNKIIKIIFISNYKYLLFNLFIDIVDQ
jgi:hypothetical protein